MRHDRIEYKLTYGQLEGDVTQAHIHFGREATSGGISAYLCFTTQTVPAGTPTCPGPREGTVEGTIEPSDVTGPAGQGIDPGRVRRAAAGDPR